MMVRLFFSTLILFLGATPALADPVTATALIAGAVAAAQAAAVYTLTTALIIGIATAGINFRNNVFAPKPEDKP